VTKPIGRSVLANRVRQRADALGVAETRMRLWVGASAFLQVLAIAAQGDALPEFLLKGGFALELRFLERARASRDIDVVLPIPMESIVEAIERAIHDREWDGFSFTIKRGAREREHVMRVEIQAFYLGGAWCSLTVELGTGSDDEREMIDAFSLEPFGLRKPDAVPCLNRLMQVAHKLHAVTEPLERNMRYRDLVDIVLIDTILEQDDDRLRASIEQTFLNRATHQWPTTLVIRPEWRAPLARMLEEMDIELTVDQLHTYIVRLIGRLLGIPMATTFEYRFIMLEGHGQIADGFANAIKTTTEGYKDFELLTTQQGYRLAHLLRYPGTATAAMLAVLERPTGDET